MVPAGEDVAAGVVGEDAAGVVNAAQAVEIVLKFGPAAGLVGGTRFFQLETEEAGHGGALVRLARIHADGGDEGRAHEGDGERAPEPGEDLGEQRVHSAAASSGVRVNW